MRPDGPITDLTEAQKRMADIAGVPVDRPGLGAEYPKMVYKPGINLRHQLESKPLPLGNGVPVSPDRLSEGHDMQIAYVDSAEDEIMTLADGWFLSPDPVEQRAEVERRAAERAKDDEIARLRAQVAAQQSGEPKRGPGRPPKAEDA